MAPNSQLVLPIALGLSLVSVAAFVVYYVFKKDDEETSDTKIKTSRVNVIEVSVPKSIVPALIGRSGSNIKDIERKSGALIHFKKFSDKDYDVCIIRGRSETTQLAETLIHEFIKQQPVIIEDHMEVPSWSCGRIIGTGGENINEISHRSGARVKVEGLAGDSATQRRISIRGTKEQIEVAKGLIDNCVAQEKCRREIEQSKRSPRMATPPAASPVPSDHSEEPPGDVAKHVRYKRPEVSGAPIEVYVSAVSSPSRFWVQFVGPQVTQLDELVNHMTEYYGNKDNRAAHALNHVSIGQVVAAVFRHDGRWYRARVHDIRPNEFDSTQQVADCFFVDYGDSEYVSIHELCELRADLLRLRFQAMECFLAGVRPAGKEEDTVAVTKSGQRWDKWNSQAVERFEELTQVARWKSLVSRTCTYKKTVTADGEKDKEIPGIKLFDVSEEGELDIGGVLIAEGWAVEVSATSPRASPPKTPTTPFGDLGNSRVLGMSGPISTRATSVPKDHKDDGNHNRSETKQSRDDTISSAKSLSSGLETTDKVISVSNLNLSYPDLPQPKLQVNGSHNNGSHSFLDVERQNLDKESSSVETLTPAPNTPILSRSSKDEFKANINRIDSHHSNLESLG